VSEFDSPVACRVAAACVGVDPAAPKTDDGRGATDTQQCAAAYTGPQCVSCAAGHYQLQGQCYFCGASTDQRRDIALTVVVAASAMCLLAVAAAFLSAASLSQLIQAFVTLQSVAMVGVEGSRSIPFARREIAAAFTYLNLINFDIEVLRPGREKKIRHSHAAGGCEALAALLAALRGLTLDASGRSARSSGRCLARHRAWLSLVAPHSGWTWLLGALAHSVHCWLIFDSALVAYFCFQAAPAFPRSTTLRSFS